MCWKREKAGCQSQQQLLQLNLSFPQQKLLSSTIAFNFSSKDRNLASCLFTYFVSASVKFFFSSLEIIMFAKQSDLVFASFFFIAHICMHIHCVYVCECMRACVCMCKHTGTCAGARGECQAFPIIISLAPLQKSS